MIDTVLFYIIEEKKIKLWKLSPSIYPSSLPPTPTFKSHNQLHIHTQTKTPNRKLPVAATKSKVFRIMKDDSASM